MTSSQGRTFTVIGAGPYGLATAAHLRGAGIDVRIFGKPMDFWQNHMPKGMLLRSPHDGSDIADPNRALTLARFEMAQGVTLPSRVPLEDFVQYGKWFQREALPELDIRSVSRLTRMGDTYRLTLEDGDNVEADNVVVATGIGSFAHYPSVFSEMSRQFVSHTSDTANVDLGRFSGKRVVVVGAGQSAIESAALLHEHGAGVEVIARQSQLRWLKNDTVVNWFNAKLNPLKAPGKIGPMGLDWLIEHPRLFTLFPRRLQERLAYRAIRPAASGWLKPRAKDLALTTGRVVVSARTERDHVHLKLDDGSARCVDHVLLGTGYRISISNYSFLDEGLLRHIRTDRGYPVLGSGFESSLSGLYFVGAPAAYSFGPLCRFVVGTRFAAHTLSLHAARKPSSRRAFA